MSQKILILRRHDGPERLTFEGRPGAWRVRIGEEDTVVELARLGDGRISVLASDGRQICGRVQALPHGVVEISSARGTRRLSLSDPLHDLLDHSPDADQANHQEEEIRALMPGRVVEVFVSAGDRIEAGALVLVLEAMKMQNEIRAQRAGVVQAIRVSSGEAVETGALMCTIQPSTG